MAIWQSMSGMFQSIICAASQAIAIFEPSLSRDTIDSPKNIRPSATPYSPPTSRSPRHTSTEWARPASCMTDRVRLALVTAWSVWILLGVLVGSTAMLASAGGIERISGALGWSEIVPLALIALPLLAANLSLGTAPC